MQIINTYRNEIDTFISKTRSHPFPKQISTRKHKNLIDTLLYLIDTFLPGIREIGKTM